MLHLHVGRFRAAGCRCRIRDSGASGKFFRVSGNFRWPDPEAPNGYEMAISRTSTQNKRISWFLSCEKLQFSRQIFHHSLADQQKSMFDREDVKFDARLATWLAFPIVDDNYVLWSRVWKILNSYSIVTTTVAEKSGATIKRVRSFGLCARLRELE